MIGDFFPFHLHLFIVWFLKNIEHTVLLQLEKQDMFLGVVGGKKILHIEFG